MKKQSIIIVFAMLLTTQVPGQQCFSNVALENARGCSRLRFGLPAEANVRHYRVEAANTPDSFEVIGTLPSSGNSVMAKVYHYDLCGQHYQYYRVGRVGMNGSLQYSDMITVAQPMPPAGPGSSPVIPVAGQTVASGN